MRTVQFLGDREAVVVEQPDPVAGPGQIVVRLVRAAICGSDLHGYRRPASQVPRVSRQPGHEPVGIVAEVGPGVTSPRPGERVLIYHRPGCGACAECRSGASNLCAGTPRERFGGADADYLRCWADQAYPLPDGLDWETAVVISCQGGTAYAPLRRLGVSGRDALVVSGLGPVGLCVLLMARALGAEAIGIDPMPERRALAERFGAAATIDPAEGDPGAAVRAWAPAGADAAIETSGHPAAQAGVLDYLRAEGAAVMVGVGPDAPALSPARLMRRQLTAVGSNLFPQRLLPEIIEVVQRRRVPLAEIITHRYPLEQAPEAFALADSATAGKIVFAWPE